MEGLLISPTILPSLAVDPGKDGGSALLGADGRTLLGCWEWLKRDRKAGTVFALTRAVAGDEDVVVELRSLHEVGVEIARGAELLLGPGNLAALLVEGLFIHPKAGKNPLDIVDLGESAALVWGPLERLATRPAPLARPQWSVWAPTVLGVNNNANADKAFPFLIRSLVSATELAGREHVRDAVAIARFGYLCQKGPEQVGMFSASAAGGKRGR